MSEVVPATMQNRRGGAPPGNKNAEKSGHWARKVKLTDVRLVDISRQNGLGQEIARQAEAIFQDGGGRDKFSELKQHVVQRYLITELLIQSLDRWLLEQPSLINRRKKSVYPILNERNRLVETSLRLAESIGLEISPPPRPSLQEFLANRAQNAAKPTAAILPAEKPTAALETQPAPSQAANPAAAIEEPAMLQQMEQTGEVPNDQPKSAGVVELEPAPDPTPGSWRARLQRHRQENGGQT